MTNAASLPEMHRGAGGAGAQGSGYTACRAGIPTPRGGEVNFVNESGYALPARARFSVFGFSVWLRFPRGEEGLEDGCAW